jgi:hypothetical protein
MGFLKRLVDIILYPYTKYKDKQRMKKRIEELKQRDPFIYK